MPNNRVGTPQWINAENKLPRNGQKVWVWVVWPAGIEYATESELDDGVWMMGSGKNYRVTHWMPMPSKPRSR